MLKINKHIFKFKGDYDKIHAEMTILLNSFIEIFGINTLKECVEDLKIISQYKVTLQELEVPIDVEKDIMKILKKRNNF